MRKAQGEIKEEKKMTEFQKIQMQNPVITEMCKMAAEIALTGSSKQKTFAVVS